MRTQVTVESVRRHKELKEFKKKFDADVEKAHDDFIREVDTRGEEVPRGAGRVSEGFSRRGSCAHSDAQGSVVDTGSRRSFVVQGEGKLLGVLVFW